MGSVIWLVLFFCVSCFGKIAVGRHAAAQYFVSDKKLLDSSAFFSAYLGQNLSGVMNVSKNQINGFHTSEVGTSFSIGKWSVFDIPLRLQNEQIPSIKTDKISITSGIQYPRARFDFPIYVGATFGIGHFYRSQSGVSAIGIDNFLFIGARFFEAVSPLGIFIEFGSKSFVSLLDDTRVSAKFAVAGVVFRF